MKKYYGISVLVFALMVLLASPVFAGGSGSKTGSVASSRQEQEQGQAQGQAQSISQNNGNTYNSNAIGSFPFTDSPIIGKPDIPLDVKLLMNQWNEATFNEIFSSFPSTMTRSIIDTIIRKRESQRENDKKVMSYEETRKEVRRDKIVFTNYPPTIEVKTLRGLPAEMKEGIDYQIIARYNFVSEDKKVSSDWLGVSVVDEAMKDGGDVLIPTGEGAERVFHNQATLLSILASFAGAGANKAGNFYGMNINPGAGFSAGKNSVEVYTFLRVKVIKILRQEVLETPPPVVESCDSIRAKIREFEEKTRNCTRLCFANLGYRAALGDLFIDLYLCTGDKDFLARAGQEYALAEKNFLQGHDIRQNKTEANSIIAQVYYNWAGVIRILDGRDNAMAFAQQKNLERIPQGFAR